MSASSYPDFWRTHERRSGTPSRRATDLDGWVASAEEIERAAAEEERRRLARELHDGVLNSLTGTSLQLHATSRLIEQDPAAARQRLREIERLVTEQQTELRAFIQQMRDGVEPSRPAHANLLIALKGLCRRASGCGPLVDLTGSDFALIPDSLVDHVYRLVEELVSNSVRHAHADFIWVEVRRWRHDVVVSVEDDGRGFAFHGRYDLPMLERKHIGPASVKERVGLLHGQMVLNSRRTGSRIEVRLPMQRATKRSSSTSRA